MVRENELEDTVKFTGRILDNEMLEILSPAGVCVNPDAPCEMNNMSTMINIMEYMALGKPIIQFDMKERKYTAGESSLYADKQYCASDFAAEALWLLENLAARKTMGEFALRRVRQGLSWLYSVNNLLAAYERALDQDAKTIGSEEREARQRQSFGKGLETQ